MHNWKIITGQSAHGLALMAFELALLPPLPVGLGMKKVGHVIVAGLFACKFQYHR